MLINRILLSTVLVVFLSLASFAQSQHLELDGTSGVIFTTPGGIARSLQVLTMETWIRVDTLNYQVIWQENYSSGFPLFSLSVDPGGYLSMSHHYSGTWHGFSSAQSLNPGQWHHLAVTHSYPGSVEFYIDGNSAGSTPTTQAIGAGGFSITTCSLGFEQANTAHFVDGALDEFRIWSVARSQAQVTADMTTTISNHPDLMLSLSFEGSMASTPLSYASAIVGAPTFQFGPTPNNGGIVVSYPGSGEDFVLSTGVNGPVTTALPPQLAAPGDALIVHFESPMGSYDFTPPVLYAQLFPTGTPPFQPVDYPEVFLDFAPNVYYQTLLLYSGQTSPFSQGLLPPGGMTFSYGVPNGLSGLSLMIQAYAVAPSANTGNTWFTATDGREIMFP